MDAMVNSITSSISGMFANQVWLATIIISMLPLAELKVGIPFALDRGYGFFKALFCGMMGSVIIVPIIALLFIPIIKALKKTKLFKKMGNAIESKVNKKSNAINKNVNEKSLVLQEVDEKKKKSKRYWIKFFSIMAFVAVPIPLTGFWTGTCIAVAIGLNFWGICGSVLLGNLIAGSLVFVLTKLLGEENVLLLMVGIIVAIILFLIIRYVFNKIKKSKSLKSESKVK